MAYLIKANALVLTICLTTLLPIQADAAERFRIIALEGNDTPTYLRIDTQTGSLSRCQEDGDVWICKAAQEDKSSLADDMDQRLAALEARISQLEEVRSSALDKAELEEALVLSETVMRRFFGMVQEIKQDMAE